jgi:hypothetical protein
MTLPDPGHAGGNQVYRPPLPPCECGHLAGVHNITINGRGQCTAWRGKHCTCRGYIPQLVPPDRAAALDRGRAGPSNPSPLSTAE